MPYQEARPTRTHPLALLDPDCPACQRLKAWRADHPGIFVDHPGAFVITNDSHRRHPHLRDRLPAVP